MTNTSALVIPAAIQNTRVTALVSAKGKTIGTRIVFGGEVKASEVKAALKAQDKKLKGNDLTKKVNEVLSGRTTLAWAEHEAMVSAIRSAGYQPDSTDVRKTGATVRFVKPSEPVSTAASLKAKIEAMGEEERKELMALLFSEATPAVESK